MRGYLDYNFPAFFKAEEMLRKEGWEVINPARLDEDDGFDISQERTSITPAELEKFIIRDVHLVVKCDAICLLPKWALSKGVAVELAVANYCKLPVYYMNELFNQISRER
jgi:hypothetical protein